MLEAVRSRGERAQIYLYDTELERFHAVVGRRVTSLAVHLGSNFNKQRITFGRHGELLPDGTVLTVDRARELAREHLAVARSESELQKAERALMRALQNYFAIKQRTSR